MDSRFVRGIFCGSYGLFTGTPTQRRLGEQGNKMTSANWHLLLHLLQLREPPSHHQADTVPGADVGGLVLMDGIRQDIEDVGVHGSDSDLSSSPGADREGTNSEEDSDDVAEEHLRIHNHLHSVHRHQHLHHHQQTNLPVDTDSDSELDSEFEDALEADDDEEEWNQEEQHYLSEGEDFSSDESEVDVNEAQIPGIIMSTQERKVALLKAAFASFSYTCTNLLHVSSLWNTKVFGSGKVDTIQLKNASSLLSVIGAHLSSRIRKNPDAFVPFGVDESWFGGKLPDHPMFYSGWKGHPFSHGKWANRSWVESDVFSSLSQGSFNFEEVYTKLCSTLRRSFGQGIAVKHIRDDVDEEMLQSLAKVHAECVRNQVEFLTKHLESEVSRWDDRLNSLLDVLNIRNEPKVKKLLQNSHRKLPEIMAKFNLSALFREDWWPDWQTSTQLVHPLDWEERKLGLFGENGLETMDENDPVLNIILNSPQLHFVSTARGQPYQWAHSASDAYHHQCARYMALGAEEPVQLYRYSDDINEMSKARIFGISGTKAAPATITLHLQRPYTVLGRNFMRCGMNRIADYRNAAQRVDIGLLGCANAPDVFPYTKYLARPEDDLARPSRERVMSLPTHVVSMDMAYGFLAIGFDDGVLAAFCMEGGDPHLVLLRDTADGVDMFNSVQLSRRLVRTSPRDGETPHDEYEYEFSLLATRNSGCLEVFILTKHVRHKSQQNLFGEFTKHCENLSSVISLSHNLERTATDVVTGFECSVNDARFSPDGLKLAVVGDAGCAWIASVRYNEERLELSQDATFDTFLPKRLIEPVKKITLDSLFSNPEGLKLDQKYDNGQKATGMSMQYLSWNCESRYFAATTDTFPWVLIFDCERGGEVVCKIHAGTPTFAVAFHPKMPYIVAFSNRIGYVHIVDLEETLNAPVDITEFAYPPRQVLLHDYQVPIEPRSGSYPDLTAFHRSRSNFPTDGGSASPQGRGNPSDNTGDGQSTAESFSTVLSKLNGLLWSDDGQRLYVSTNRRVLMHTVLERTAPSLVEVVCRQSRRGGSGKRKRVDSEPEKIVSEDLLDAADDTNRTDAEIIGEFSKQMLSQKPWGGHWEYSAGHYK